MSEKVSKIIKIAKKLHATREKYQKAVKALAPKHTGNEWEEFQSALKEKILLERKYSLANDWETALRIDWKPHWNSGAPCPYIISSEEKLFLIYLIQEEDHKWDGSYTTVINKNSETPFPLALIEFKKSYAHKLESINDEVWEGHPLYEKGLEAYAGHIIQNSKWLEQLKNVHKVHTQYHEESWEKKKHYLLLFHDTIFECIAEEYKIEIHHNSFKNLLKLATDKLFKSP